MTEEWRKVEGYETSYEVSNLGRVKSLISKTKKILKPNNVRGYLQVGLFNGSGIQKKYLVHKLVAKAFLPNLQDKSEINHKDGDKSNNSVQNLEWVSRQENMLHAFDNGLAKKALGENSHFAKLTKAEVIKIKTILAKGNITHLKIAELFGVSKSAIAHISRGKTWSRI